MVSRHEDDSDDDTLGICYAQFMTRIQTQIVDLIAQLPLDERKELIAHVQQSGLLEESFYECMTDDQRAILQQGIDQANDNQGEPAPTVLARIAKGLGLAGA